MPYATPTQVAQEAKVSTGFKNAAAATDGVPAVAATSPSLDKVLEVIAEVEAMIDAMVGTRYRYPLTNTSQLVLRGISLALVTERVREIMAVTSNTQKVDQVTVKTTADRARTTLQNIVNGAVLLTGEVSASAVAYNFPGGFRNQCIPTFRRGETQW